PPRDFPEPGADVLHRGRGGAFAPGAGPATAGMAVNRSNERGGGPMRRDPLQVIGRTVADHASPHYRFERFVVAADDGGGRYRVNLAIPAPPPPAAGFPAFWMLDGNAALQAFDEQLLAGLARGTPQVLVFVGHDNPLRIDAAARMRDYT